MLCDPEVSLGCLVARLEPIWTLYFARRLAFLVPRVETRLLHKDHRRTGFHPLVSRSRTPTFWVEDTPAAGEVAHLCWEFWNPTQPSGGGVSLGSTLWKSLTSKDISATLVATRGCQAIRELGFTNNRGSLSFCLNHEAQGTFSAGHLSGEFHRAALPADSSSRLCPLNMSLLNT